jgi:hypothetical protein
MAYRLLNIAICGWCAGIASLYASEDPVAPKERPPDLSHEIAEGNYIDSAFREPAKSISSPDQIPRPVMRLLAKIAGERKFELAPIGATTRTTRLDRALRFATLSENFCIVCYDVITRSTASGLRVVVVHFYLPRIEPETVDAFLVARCLDECRDMKAVRAAFKHKRMKEYRPTYLDF